MLIKINENCSELMNVFSGLSQVMRCCWRDEAFCEGITFHQFMILDTAAKAKELNMSDLHKILSVQKSTTTRLVNPLINKGLLRRDKADHDSRAVKLTLTKEGLETHKKVWLCLIDFYQRVTNNIPEEKRAEVLECVKIFIAAIKNSSDTCNCCKPRS
ncbi:MAG: MarR family transcriptional regulator [Deltaproteobacteria bacterium]|nr:MarR family transcriptional regulator [Deltaproteobacteria bacterium]